MALPLSLLELSASQVDIYIQLIHRGEAARREQCTLRLSNPGRERVHWKLKSNCSALYSVPVNNEWLDPGCNVDVIIHCRRPLNLTRATLMEDHVFKLVATCGARTQEWRLPVVTHLPQALLPVVGSQTQTQASPSPEVVEEGMGATLVDLNAALIVSRHADSTLTLALKICRQGTSPSKSSKLRCGTSSRLGPQQGGVGDPVAEALQGSDGQVH